MKKFAPLVLFMSSMGCSSITHELQPHRLWRWNYQEAPNRTDDALFSIDDPKIPSMSSEEADHKNSAGSTASDQSARHD